MKAEFHDLADLVTNTCCALLGTQTVRSFFYKQFGKAKEKEQNHQCENTLLVLMKLLKAENRDGGIRCNLATITAGLRE
jgi:hypothetical protein